MRKYSKIVNPQCVQRRIEVKNENVEECKQFYIKQRCEIIEEEKTSEGTTYIDIIYYEKR